jgi:hypothetical protein
MHIVRALGITLWILAALFTLIWAYGVRSYVQRGQGPSQQTVNQTMLFSVSLVLIPMLRISPFHLLWLFFASFVIGALSLTFPFSLLSIPGRLFGSICCFGLAGLSYL